MAGDSKRGANEDLKARMREALAKKNSEEHGVHGDTPPREKAHGPEVSGAAPPPMHRRKTGGGGA